MIDQKLKIAIAQVNPILGDLEGNLEKIVSIWESVDGRVHLVCFPELTLTGYPPEDLLLRKDFLRDCEKTLEKLIEISGRFDSACILGVPLFRDDIYNSAVLIHKGRCLGEYYKRFLPNYGVFDEKRYFRRGENTLLFSLNGFRIGVSVCEDIWYPDGLERYYALSGAYVVVSLNASPYHYGKARFKENFLRARAEDNFCYVVYVNMVGGQDELVFDGRSMVVSPDGEIIARARAFEEDVLLVSLDISRVEAKRLIEPRMREEFCRRVQPVSELSIECGDEEFSPRVEDSPEEEAEVYEAIKLAIRDYFYKNGFKGVILGLSGGIDSGLTCVLAVDALGKDKVRALFMPSRFTSIESYEDSRELANNLGIPLYEIGIDGIFDSYRDTLRGVFGFEDFTVADENVQARIRANLLLYLSNREGYLVLSTSNKSESAVGYTTIYGDMSGGFAPLKDVYKVWVYRLARYRNSISPVIPKRMLEKPPSAELRPNQRDQDTLPPYEILDEILRLHLEECLGISDIVRLGFEESTVKRVFTMLRQAEYKRKQAPVGPKITKRAFGKDYRMPITNKYL